MFGDTLVAWCTLVCLILVLDLFIINGTFDGFLVAAFSGVEYIAFLLYLFALCFLLR